LYRLIALLVPATIAACQDTGNPLAPDAVADPSTIGAAAVEESAAAPHPTGALVPNRIAFTSYTADGGADIWTMDPQGGSLAHLTSFSGMEYGPSWSPDHKHIAFGRMRGSYYNVYLADADGTHKHWALPAAYTGALDETSWSPDGTNLLVRVEFQNSLCIGKIDVATGNLALVAPAGVFGVEGGFPVYDPTGKTIYYVDRNLKTIKQFTPGGALTTVFTSNLYIAFLAISPDGTRIAYSASPGGSNSDIYVLNLATKVTKQLTFNPTTDHDPTWSPDGTKLAFASDRSGKTQIWTMNSSNGGSLTRITSRAYGAVTPAWVY
jgi:TolB protein